jgi:hypothetical protein
MLWPTVTPVHEFSAKTKDATYPHFGLALWRAVSHHRRCRPSQQPDLDDDNHQRQVIEIPQTHNWPQALAQRHKGLGTFAPPPI